MANDSLPLIGAGRLRLLGLVLAAAVASCLPARRAAPSMARFRVLLETSKGPIVIEVIPDWAPRGADRFRELVTAGYYDDARFFRVVKDRWAQFGINGDPAVAKRWRRFHLVEATIDDIQAQYRAGNLRPADVVRMYLARIAAYDRSNVGQPLNGGVGQQPLNSFMHVNEQAIHPCGPAAAALRGRQCLAGRALSWDRSHPVEPAGVRIHLEPPRTTRPMAEVRGIDSWLRSRRDSKRSNACLPPRKLTGASSRCFLSRRRS